MNVKKVAIIGGGRAGLVSAKYVLENGLEPIVFESTSQIGGQWSRNNGKAIWNGMYSDISKYSMMFHDHPWPKDTPIFCSVDSVHEYLKSYAEKFKITEHIRLQTKVEFVEKMDDNKWKLSFLDLKNELKRIEVFDFLIIASGLHSKPRIPVIENSEKFEGIQIHSSKFQLNDPQFKDRRVVVLGCSSSGTEIAASLVGHAKSVACLFPRPYLITPRLVKYQTSLESDFKIAPVDIFINRRCVNYPDLSNEEQQNHAILFSRLFSHQTEKAESHPDLFVDLKNPNQEILFSCSDYFIQHVSESKIKPIKSKIKKFNENSVELENGLVEEADAIIYCTGYDLEASFLESRILEKLKYNNEKNRFPIILYKYTFQPELDNLALVGQIDGLFYTGIELQAIWASHVFSCKKKLPSKEEMLEEIAEFEKKRFDDKRSQFPNGRHTIMVDNIAKEIGLLPDLEAIKNTNKELYEKLWHSAVISNHFFLNNSISIDIINEIHEMNSRLYKINNSFKIDDVVKEFKKLYPLPNGLFENYRK